MSSNLYHLQIAIYHPTLGLCLLSFKIAYWLYFEAMLQNFAYYAKIMLHMQYSLQIQHFLSLILLKP